MEKTVPQYFRDQGISDNGKINYRCLEEIRALEQKGKEFYNEDELPGIIIGRYTDWILYRIHYEAFDGLPFPPDMDSTKDLIGILRNCNPKSDGKTELCKLLEIVNDFSNLDDWGRGRKIDHELAIQLLSKIDFNKLSKLGEAEYHYFNEKLKSKSYPASVSIEYLQLALNYFTMTKSRSEINAKKARECNHMIQDVSKSN